MAEEKKMTLEEVNEYMKQNPQIQLTELMKTVDAQKIFKGSKYNVKLNQ